MPEDKQLYLRIDGPKSSDDIWPVSVFTDAECSLQSINEILVAEGCAYYVGMARESADTSGKLLLCFCFLPLKLIFLKTLTLHKIIMVHLRQFNL